MENFTHYIPTSLFGLLALITGYLYYHYRDRDKNKLELIKSASVNKRAGLIEMMLNDLGVTIDTSTLGETSKYNLIVKLLNAKTKKYLIISLTSIILAVIVAFLIHENSLQQKKQDINGSSVIIDTIRNKGANESTNIQASGVVNEEMPVIVNNRPVTKPSSYIIPRNRNLKLIQFEIFGEQSAYIKTKTYFAAVGPKEYETFELDPNHTINPSVAKENPMMTNPVFNVVLENTSDKDIVLSKIVYRVKKVGQVMGGSSGVLYPEAKYIHTLIHMIGDQELNLTPPFVIGAHSIGSFLLELKTDEKDAGLCWLMKVWFIQDFEEGGVSTEEFQLIMTGPVNW